MSLITSTITRANHLAITREPQRLMVVETHDDRYLGVLSAGPIVDGDFTLTIRTGLPGQPPQVPYSDVESITPADTHPDVEPAPTR